MKGINFVIVSIGNLQKTSSVQCLLGIALLLSVHFSSVYLSSAQHANFWHKDYGTCIWCHWYSSTLDGHIWSRLRPNRAQETQKNQNRPKTGSNAGMDYSMCTCLIKSSRWTANVNPSAPKQSFLIWLAIPIRQAIWDSQGWDLMLNLEKIPWKI